MNIGPLRDSLSPATNAEEFGSIQEVLNARNENGTRFLVFDQDDYRLVPGLLDPDLEARSLDELAGVIIMERTHEHTETYYNGSKGYHTAMRLTLQSARDGSGVSSVIVDGGNPPLSIPHKIYNTRQDDSGSDPDDAALAGACRELIGDWVR